MKSPLPLLIAAGLAIGAMSNVRAADEAWVLRFGAHVINPQTNHGQLAGMKASINSDNKPTFSLDYLVTPAWGVDCSPRCRSNTR